MQTQDPLANPVVLAIELIQQVQFTLTLSQTEPQPFLIVTEKDFFETDALTWWALTAKAKELLETSKFVAFMPKGLVIHIDKRLVEYKFVPIGFAKHIVHETIVSYFGFQFHDQKLGVPSLKSYTRFITRFHAKVKEHPAVVYEADLHPKPLRVLDAKA